MGLPAILPQDEITPQLIWFYKPPLSSDEEILLENFDFHILTKQDESLRDRLLKSNPDLSILQYVRIDAIHDPCGFVLLGEREDCSCDTGNPFSNNVAWMPEDLCYIIKYHPEWIIRDSHGDFIATESYVYMDPGNQEWREFWLKRVKYTQEVLGWNGVFLDNVEGSIGKYRKLGIDLLLYDNETYRIAIRDFLQYIYDEYFRSEDRLLFANIIESSDHIIWFEYLKFLDGAMNEAWGVDWQDGYVSVNRWKADLALAEQMQAQNKSIITVIQGDQDNLQRQLFSYASYLLINSGQAYYRYANSDTYNQVWLYETYQYDLGQPIGIRQEIEENRWKREFANGFVEVNPSTNKVNIFLNNEFMVQQID